eukprot:TRINITY_DN9259_c0_g1_i1.p1 TRINITY_DN9259_c0_g1~~TRINITY_DN9259_c0_g1_i1.p1  ORF type:complete len:270 (+),score=59.79 TRINITY_DN9259_c0_g1_i1:18-827(+)
MHSKTSVNWLKKSLRRRLNVKEPRDWLNKLMHTDKETKKDVKEDPLFLRHTLFSKTQELNPSKKKTNKRYMSSHKLRLDEFAFRQFDDPNYSGTKITMTKEDFMNQLSTIIDENTTLAEGYAPFCKHIFVENFCGDDIKVGSMPITPDNESLLKTGYVARTEQELPVLSRWFPKEALEIPSATYLDLILYSKEQIGKENEAMGKVPVDEDYEWGIISIKGQLEPHELPMNPITVMRNSLGKEEGGSGVPLDRSKYLESVEYWKLNASIQ